MTVRVADQHLHRPERATRLRSSQLKLDSGFPAPLSAVPTSGDGPVSGWLRICRSTCEQDCRPGLADLIG